MNQVTNLTTIFDDASAIMTVVSLITFLGILWWTYCYKRKSDFDDSANLPFVEDGEELQKNERKIEVEKRHV